jgi:hypothetical protein
VGVSGAPTVDDWRAALGVTLDEFMRVGFALYVAAIENPGSVTRDLLTLDNVVPIFRPLSAPQARAIIDRHFANTPEGHSTWGREREQRGREKWCPNPLQSRPIVAVGRDDLVVPAPHYLISKVTPTGLYFTGLEAFGTSFTDALGAIFERYVGAQFGQLGAAVAVLGEITYGPHNQKTCDYFVVTPESALLVEVKTARPTLDFRRGATEGLADARRKLLHARDQLNVTELLLADAHPALADIPKDRPRQRLIVTLEPFFLRQTFGHEVIFDDGDVVPVASAHDLDVVVGTLAANDDAGSRLRAALTVTDASPADLLNSIRDLDPVPNKIIDEAWTRWADWDTGVADAQD